MESHHFSRRSLCLRLFTLFCLAVALFQKQSQANDNLPSYPQAFLRSEYGQPEEEIESIPRNSRLYNEAIRIMKRKQQYLNTDELQYFSKEQVDKASKEEFKVIPDPIIYTSQIINKGFNCSSIMTDLHENHVRPELQLHPQWIHKSQLIGSCPTHYVTRELPPMYSPSVVIEAVCTCNGSKCSREGHQCLPVSRHIPVWVRQGPDYHVLDVEELTVACACIRRPSASGNFIYSSGFHN